MYNFGQQNIRKTFITKYSHGRDWIAMSSHSLIGSIFLNETVNSEQYLHVLQNDFRPQLTATQMPLHTQLFMQNSITPHTANTVLDFLDTTFSLCIISHHYPDHHNCEHFWPPHSPDAKPCDYFLWGFLKKKLFPQKPATLTELTAMIIQLCGKI
jgi:hypothetical protein